MRDTLSPSWRESEYPPVRLCDGSAAVTSGCVDEAEVGTEASSFDGVVGGAGAIPAVGVTGVEGNRAGGSTLTGGSTTRASARAAVAAAARAGRAGVHTSVE